MITLFSFDGRVLWQNAMSKLYFGLLVPQRPAPGLGGAASRRLMPGGIGGTSGRLGYASAPNSTPGTPKGAAAASAAQPNVLRCLFSQDEDGLLEELLEELILI